MPYVSGFLPSRSAPLFHNGPWPAGLDLRISLAGLPSASIDVTKMGLCGGMSFLARDIHEIGAPQLRSTSSQGIPLPLGRHILSRLLDSFLGPGVIPYWIHATQELDHGTWFWGKGLYAETVDAARQVMRYVDAGGLVPIGVVLAQSAWPWDVFQNHVELVYGYDLVGTQLTLHVYDCNYEGSDNVTISSTSAPRRPPGRSSPTARRRPASPATCAASSSCRTNARTPAPPTSTTGTSASPAASRRRSRPARPCTSR